MQPKKILVVEDNEDTREILQYRIKNMGDFEVLMASHGREALDIGNRIKPDLVIMDLKMPVMDGWETTKAIRGLEWGKNLPIIALTAQAMEKDEEKAMEAGCDDYIAKPIVDYGILQKKIAKYIK